MDKRTKIRIMHIAQAAGGVDRYIRMLLKYMNNERYENILICSQDYKEKDYGENVIFFEQIEMCRDIKMISDCKAVRAIRKLIRKYQPDIVYVHSSKAGALGRMANIGIKNICIYNPHGWAFNMRCSAKKQRIYTIIERGTAFLCDKIVCISPEEKRSALKQKICSENKLHTIVNGVDVEAYKSQTHDIITRKNLKIQEDAFVIGMVGRVSPQKAPDIFIHAAQIVKQSIPNAYFIIVGDGELKNEVQEYAAKNGLQDLLLITGWVENPLSYVEVFDVAMLLSRWEGFGLVLPEYMMVGKPVIATKVDAIPDIIMDQENGMLVETENPQAAANAVLELYNNQELYCKLVKNGLLSANMYYNVARVAKETETMFEGILSGKQ